VPIYLNKKPIEIIIKKIFNNFCRVKKIQKNGKSFHNKKIHKIIDEINVAISKINIIACIADRQRLQKRPVLWSSIISIYVCQIAWIYNFSLQLGR
jgi:hypothetical protein